MFSLPDMTVLGILALLVFGPERLPGMMRQAGRVMREVQNTSQSFIREMERVAEVPERPAMPEEALSTVEGVPGGEAATEPPQPSDATGQ